jgi:hypothetical protein
MLLCPMDGSLAHFTQAIFLLTLRLVLGVFCMVENGGIVLHTLLDLEILATASALSRPLGSTCLSVLTLFWLQVHPASF